GVEPAAALFGVVERHQRLRDGGVVAGERVIPRTHQLRLARSGGGLLFLQTQLACSQAQCAAAERDGAGGDEDARPAFGAQLGGVCGKCGKTSCVRLSGLLVDQEGRADLDDDTSCLGQGGGGEGGGHWTSWDRE